MYMENKMKQMKRTMVAVLLALPWSMGGAYAQSVQNDGIAPGAVQTNAARDNWYGQVGIDLSLQNPYGCNFMHVFPDGYSFGVDVAVGKWFTPEFGLRGRLNWENGIFRRGEGTWLRGFSRGYVALTGDVQLNLHNLFGTYDPDRMWNFYVFPRAGALYNVKSRKGSPLLGLGVGSTFRLNNKWSLYADLAYQVMSSVNGMSTDTGAGNNGYFDLQVGVQMNLTNSVFHRVGDGTLPCEHAVATTSFWSNWFVQAGLGMSLLNPYGANFSHVFPNGKTLGVNLGVGKWFTPEVGLRAGLNWQNGLVGNKHLGWMDPDDAPGQNHEKGGYGAAYVDVFFDLHNIICGYEADRFWNAIVFPRTGIDSNFATGSASPLVGVGTEQAFRLNDRLKLFVDVAYQVTTSEFMDSKSYTGTEGSNSNGWLDFNIGLQLNLGKTRFKRLR